MKSTYLMVITAFWTGSEGMPCQVPPTESQACKRSPCVLIHHIHAVWLQLSADTHPRTLQSCYGSGERGWWDWGVKRKSRKWWGGSMAGIFSVMNCFKFKHFPWFVMWLCFLSFLILWNAVDYIFPSHKHVCERLHLYLLVSCRCKVKELVRLSFCLRHPRDSSEWLLRFSA